MTAPRWLAALAPLRSKALLAYSRLLPTWAHPFLDQLDQNSRFVGGYIRLVLVDTLISLSAAAFIRLLMGVLVPSESIPAVALAGIAFAALNVTHGLFWKATQQRLQLALYSQIYRRIRADIVPSLFHPRRLAYLGTATAQSSVDAPARVATVCAFRLLPLISDIPAVVSLVVVFLLLAGWSFAPLLLVYFLYVLADLFMTYSRPKPAGGDRSSVMARSLLRVYSTNKASFDRAGLYGRVSPLIFSAAARDLDANRLRSVNAGEQTATAQNTADMISVVLLITVASFVAAGNAQIGQLLAGILVLMRLTPMVKRSYSDYISLRSEARSLSWFKGVYDDVRQEQQAQASRRLPVAGLEAVERMELRNVHLRIPTPQVPSSSPQLSGISLDLRRGDFVAVVGRSGSSKSTLLRVLVGAYPISFGQRLINGYDMEQINELELHQAAIYLDRDNSQIPPALLDLLDGSGQRRQRGHRHPIHQLLKDQGRLVALDQPELWLHEIVEGEQQAWVLAELARRHLLVVATRDEGTAHQASRLLVMNDGVCSESQAFRQRTGSGTNRAAIAEIGR